MYSEDEDDEVFEGLYENGHWEWDSKADELVFISDLPSLDEISVIAPTCIIGPIEFKDDLDLLEQHRFKKRFQRKMTENDVVTIQDVKDVVLYTAPQSILTPAIINIMHLEMTERFLRALVLYFQYYLQIADEMCRRSLEQKMKIRTENSIVIEKVYRENIEDLRLVVAKEYCAMFVGGGEFRKYHHMGASRSSPSLSVKDAILFETILRISIQIIWLSLGRKAFNRIELEVHRIFKSTAFNVAEHRLHTHYEDKMSPEERFVLLGHCLKHKSRNISRSPLLDEVFCYRNIDFRLYGLGCVKFKKLEPRLRLIERMLIAPEDVLLKMGYSLGIIGLPRNNFDTMLREIEMPAGTTSSSLSSRSSSVRSRSVSRASRAGLKKNSVKAQKKLYADIYFPEKEETEMPSSFPSQTAPNNACSQTQRLKWLRRVARYNEERVKRNQLKNMKRK